MRQEEGFSFSFPVVFEGFFSGTMHLFKAVKSFPCLLVVVHLCCPQHILDRQTDKNTAAEENTHPEIRKMHVVRWQAREPEITEKHQGMSQRHVLLSFECWARDSHRELPLHVFSCIVRFLLKRRLLLRILLLFKGCELFSTLQKLLELFLCEKQKVWDYSQISW